MSSGQTCVKTSPHRKLGKEHVAVVVVEELRAENREVEFSTSTLSLLVMGLTSSSNLLPSFPIHTVGLEDLRPVRFDAKPERLEPTVAIRSCKLAAKR